MREKVVIAMSGGVDSSVAAYLLVKAGYDVVGIMLRLWTDTHACSENKCCTPEAIAEAQKVAYKLNIPFYAIDAQEPFKKTVVSYFINEYAAGNTPNPCLLCNKTMRWDFMLREAQALGGEFLATGHYARIATNPYYQLQKGVDTSKDQSYVLAFLTSDNLKKTMFPLGELTKPEVRAIAKEIGLEVAEKPDSQDLCFIGDNGYREFLERMAPQCLIPGPIVDTAGKLRGTHTGLAGYTIGQRKKLNVASLEPMFVMAKNMATNTLVIGEKNALVRDSFFVSGLHWVLPELPRVPYKCMVKCRYKAPLISASISYYDNDLFLVNCDESLSDITSGQGAVFYNNDLVLGAGIIV